MGFKKRLVIAFMIIIIIPITLICATGAMIVKYQMNSIQETYDVESNTLQVIANPLRLLSRMTRKVYDDLKTVAESNPDKLIDPAYLNGLNFDLIAKYSFLIVKKGSEYIYIGNYSMFSQIEEELAGIEAYKVASSSNDDSGIYLSGKISALVKHQTYTAADGSAVTVFIVTDVNTIVPQFKMSAVQAVIAFASVILITAGVLVVWLYRSVVRPLNVLTLATKRMKAGDLEFSISGDPEDELGQLCEDFEEMRTHLKELIDVRLQYERDTTELISNISHDLKTPLTAIKGYTEGIMDGVADTEEKREKYLVTIYTKAADMSVLVDELAFYSKIDNNNVPYNFAKINVDDYFEDCVEELSLDMEVKNVKLSYNSQLKEGQRIIADPEQLRRVVNNVIGNAVKYMDKPAGDIEIRAKEIGRFVQIEIQDNGAGIDVKDISMIFDRFYRADASRNSKQGGTGLGLAIAKKIIEDHSGRIWASSKLHEGTTIYFTLPMDKAAEETDTEDGVVVKRAMLLRVWDRSRSRRYRKDKENS